MDTKRLIITLLLVFAMAFPLTACGGGGDASASAEESTADTVVVYFSATGNTREVAEIVAEAEGADLYEIVPEDPYTEEDLDYGEARASAEQNDPSVRPGIASDPIDLTKYKKVYIGYPIWFGQAPRIMDTFVESNEFGDCTVIPFCTSGSSPIGDTPAVLEKEAGSGSWLEGQRFSEEPDAEEIKAWVESLQR